MKKTGEIEKAKILAEEKIRKLKKFAPLYGIIPVKQKKGVHDIFEMLRQGAFLVSDAIGLSSIFK